MRETGGERKRKNWEEKSEEGEKEERSEEDKVRRRGWVEKVGTKRTKWKSKSLLSLVALKVDNA